MDQEVPVQTSAAPQRRFARSHGADEAPPMLSDLDRVYRRLGERKSEMLARLGALTEAQRRTPPTPADWSPLQVLDHVVIVEEWMAGSAGAELPENARVPLRAWLFMTFGGGAMRLGLRVPTLAAAGPGCAPEFTSVARRWDEARTRLRLKLGGVTRETRSRPIALHPAAGPLNAGQVLALLDAHLAYHLRDVPPTTA